MRNIITLSVFIVFMSANSLQAQVYFSRYNSEKMYFGPKNVLNSFDGVKEYYINQLGSDIQSLHALITKRDSLEQATKLSKKDKRVLKALNQNRESIERDMVNLSILVRNWTDYNEPAVGLLKDLCYLYDEGDYTYHKSDLVIQTQKANNTLRLVEFIDVVTVKYPEPRFVKKRADNCNEKNLDKCLIYCLTDQESYVEDFTGKHMEFYKIGYRADVTYSESNNRIVREAAVVKDEAVEVHTLSIKKTGMEIPIARLKIVACN